jgi:hypothetical protein
MTPLEQCLRCNSEEAIDIRHLNGSQAFENHANMSPNRTPIGCCRVRVVSTTLSENAAPVAATKAG